MSRSPPRTTTTYEAASAYVAAGLSIIPISTDGSKSPPWRALPFEWNDTEHRNKHTWKPFQSRLPTPDELREWFLDSPWGTNYGIAIIGGAVSGGLEIIDLDNMSVVEPWENLVNSSAPGLLDKIVFVQSPRPGRHGYFRSLQCSGNEKLARDLVLDTESGNLRAKTLIEIKGEAGYVLAPGSPASCHPTGRRYEYVSEKTLADLVTITEAERKVVLDAARALNRIQSSNQGASTRRESQNPVAGSRPGDLYNAYASWSDILVPHGWQFVGRDSDGTEHWRRPGKSLGQSASANFAGTDLLHVFSENADPFEGGRTYSKFAAYALLEHANDFEKAALALAVSDVGKLALPHQRRRRVRP